MAQQPCLEVSKKRRLDLNASQKISFEDVSQMDAQTYLSSVAAQASQLPHYFDAKKPSTNESSKARARTSQKKSSSTSSAFCLAHLLSPSASLTPPPSTAVLPAAPRAWVDTVLADVVQLRDYLQKCRAHFGKTRTFPYALPTLKERAAWHAFLLGPAEAQGNVNNYFGQDDEDEDKGNSSPDQEDTPGEETTDQDTREAKTEPEPVEEWRQHLPPTGFAPNTSFLLQMDQVMVFRLLSHLAYYSQQGWHMTANRAAWSYALLACLETPLHRDQAVVLYDWLKALTAERAQNRRPSCLASLNLIICIVALYFEQGNGFATTMQVPEGS